MITVITLTSCIFMSLIFKGSTLYKFLICLMLSTVILSGLINEPIQSTLIVEGFLSLSICVLTFSLWTYKVTSITTRFKIENTYLYKTLVAVSSITLLINLYILLVSYEFVLIADVSIQEYKNDKLANAYLNSVIPGAVLLFSHALSPLAYLTLILHFYFLMKRDKRNAIICLILSLNIVLYTLQAFSRSALVQFSLIYLAILFVIYGGIDQYTKKLIRKSLIITIGATIIVFFSISYYRFGEGGYYYVPNHALINDPVMYSIFEYSAQWYKNGLSILASYESTDLWYGKSFRPLIDRVFIHLVDDTSYFELRQETLGIFATKFNGLFATVVYDFGFAGALVVFFVWAMLIFYFRPIGGAMSISSFANFFFLLTPIIMFFQGNYFSYLHFNLAFIYSLIFFTILRVKRRRSY